MTPALHRPSVFRTVAVGAGVYLLCLLGGCQEPPKQIDGHDVIQTKRINGKTVNILKADDRDKQQTIEEAQDMKKTTDQVQFTPEEQAAHK